MFAEERKSSLLSLKKLANFVQLVKLRSKQLDYIQNDGATNRTVATRNRTLPKLDGTLKAHAIVAAFVKHRVRRLIVTNSTLARTFRFKAFFLRLRLIGCQHLFKQRIKLIVKVLRGIRTLA